jgi:hypothetical protein
VFIVESPPAAMSSFAADLLERLREELLGGVQSLSGTSSYPLFRHAVTPFSGGSDHYIFSDPSVGVPMPMLIQWPDKFWHTSGDTLDKVDPRMLGLVGGLAATYAYFIASAGAREVRWLGLEMLARFRMRLVRDVQNELTDAFGSKTAEELAASHLRLKRTLQFARDREKEAMATLTRLAPESGQLVRELQDEVKRDSDNELANATAALLAKAKELGLQPKVPTQAPQEPDEWERQSARLVPGRLFPGPVSPGPYLYKLPPEKREELRSWFNDHRSDYSAMSTLANYWVDGERTVAQIADLVEDEIGKRNVQLLVKHYQLLAELGLMSLRPVEAAQV